MTTVAFGKTGSRSSWPPRPRGRFSKVGRKPIPKGSTCCAASRGRALSSDPVLGIPHATYPRSLLEKVGGFDEEFFFGGEDTDLALRAKREGASERYVDNALVWHAVLPRSFAGALREAVARPSFALIVARHDEQRAHLYVGYSRNKSHATLLLAGAGLAVFGRSKWIRCLMALPYVTHKLQGRVD